MEDKILKQIGERLAAFRKAKGLSQSKLAEKAGLSGEFTGRLERGVSNFSIKTIFLDRIYLKGTRPHPLPLSDQHSGNTPLQNTILLKEPLVSAG